MSSKLAFGGLVAVAVLALSAGTASAHPPGGFYGGGGYYGRPVYVQPVYQPVYRPVYVSPFPAYNSGFGYTTPVYGGYNSGFGYPSYGYGRGYGGSFNTVNFGVYRPGFNANFGFVIR